MIDMHKFMKEKKKLLGIKPKPYDPTNEKRWGDQVSNLSGSRDLLQEINPLPGDVWVCEDCLRKFATLDGLQIREVVFVLGGEKCTFCGRPLWALKLRGKRVFVVKRIYLTLREVWQVLGKQRKRSPKVMGTRLW